jgi:hypothetical protein
VTHTDWYLIAEQPAPAPLPARPEGCAALRAVLDPVPRVSRSCAHFPDGFEATQTLVETRDSKSERVDLRRGLVKRCAGVRSSALCPSVPSSDSSPVHDVGSRGWGWG